MTTPLGVAIIGAGLIGQRRATEAARHVGSRCVIVADTNEERAKMVADGVGADYTTNWEVAIARNDVDAVVVSTPNGYLMKITWSALAHGHHVLVEKPMGRNLVEAKLMQLAAKRSDRILKVGFNHRYHPAISEAHTRFVRGDIGPVINIRCRYGHGGRPGYEKEWRGNRHLAGGGELTDQGVHVVDLFHWFAGVPQQAFGVIQTAVWPLGDLEDNGFGTFIHSAGVTTQFHTSWTQWKNLFSLEVFGSNGAVIVDGLGRSYGTETLTVYRRKPEGGCPDREVIQYGEEDTSWQLEWVDFLNAIHTGSEMLGTADDGVIAMRMLDALYRSAKSESVVKV